MSRGILGLGLGLAKPKQIFVFGPKPNLRLGNRGWRLSAGAVQFCRKFFFWEIQHTVVFGTKDRKSVFNSTSEQYIATKGWSAAPT
jgi:hypothetical protein